MNRFITCPALALRVRPSGESNREAFFLTGESGIIRAFIYGGPKSKLRSYVSPFHSGTLYLYHDPVRDSYKVSDFDVRDWRSGLRELYERAIYADIIAETILAASGGGSDWAGALRLAGRSLDALESSDAETARRIVVHFLWNWAELLGVRPDLEDEDENITIKNPGALHWLKIVEDLEPAMLSRFLLDEVSMRSAKALCIEILASALGRRLASWNSL
jgi:DNA repair protein RecO (recombination protein O)